MRRHALAALTLAALLGCGTDLPEGTTSFTVGRTTVRTDSLLDDVGAIWWVGDSTRVPARGPVRRWYQALAARSGDSVFQLVRRLGAVPVNVLLQTWAERNAPDTLCGFVAPGERRCFTGNDALRREVVAFFEAAAAYAPQLRSLALEELDAASRRRDLADVYLALTRTRSLDSSVLDYVGYPELQFDITLARAFSTGNTTPHVDPARPRGTPRRMFLTPDQVYPTRSYRSPTYVWLMLVHQMSHEAVRRLFTDRPELLSHGFHLRAALELEIARSGYAGAFWDDILSEQLARALTIRILARAAPTLTWAARTEALNQNMPLVPWLEDILSQYESDRQRYPNLSSFAPELGAFLDTIPLDTCRGAPTPGVVLVAAGRHRATVGWIAPSSPFLREGLLVGDTVNTIDGDSVAAADLLLPTRQMALKWSQHLPAELGILGIRRRGRNYAISIPINWENRQAVRVASQARSAVRGPGEEVPICRWIRSAVRR
ncbi:MAG TPA: DUF4932 domain-containing protein [Gemmatimonadales bacterium]|nr:DUF4932 domain-containing protein [Gemmatimonadales bacterium]